MSLLLDALQRSEQRPLMLAPTEDAATQVAPEAAAPEAGAQHPALGAAAPTSAAATANARQAAQAMVGATAQPPSYQAPQAPQARLRRLVLALLVGLLLAVVTWFGWQYWQSSQTSMLVVAPPSVQTVGAEAGLPVPASDADAPAEDVAPADPASAAAQAEGHALDPAAPQQGAQPVGDAASSATLSSSVQAPPTGVPVPDKASAAAPVASEKGPPIAARPDRAAPTPEPTRDVAGASPALTPGAAADAATSEAPPSAAPRGMPPGAASGDAGRTGAAAPSPAVPAMLVRSEAQRRLQDAWTALGQNDAVRAQALYQQVLAERPDDPDATLGLAVALHRQRQLEPAWKAYQRSLHLWPENETARTGLLAILSESDPVTAESRLQEWVQTRPRDAAAQSALGNLLGRQGRWAEALGPLTQAQALAPERAAHAYNLAVALDQARRYEDALRMYRQALQLGGTGIPVKAIEYRLQDLQEQLSR